jgi:hypothetical protein
MTTHKQKMLNSYKGIFSETYPVAPEFWFYYPAKVLGISMVELQREIPHWKALLETFRKFGCEGWGTVQAERNMPDIEKTSSFKKLNDEDYMLEETIDHKGNRYTSRQKFNKYEPSWIEEYPVKSAKELDAYLQYMFENDVVFDFKNALAGYNETGEDYLLEYDLGLPFFDNIAFAWGFENALMFFMDGNDRILDRYYERFIHFQKMHLQKSIQNTAFESYFIGCGYSCVSLIGPKLWRRWDKPYIRAMADMLHENGKLLHIHFHGKCMEVLDDFAEMGIDCVCPFERTPGDINGLIGLKEARNKLNDAVAFNGNVHTVQALAEGTEQIVRQQVMEIREAFAGLPRLIIGTGDQVPGQTPEENIYAMIDEGRKEPQR